MLHTPTSGISIDDLTQNTLLELALMGNCQCCNNEHQMLMLGVRCDLLQTTGANMWGLLPQIGLLGHDNAHNLVGELGAHKIWRMQLFNWC